MERKDNTLTHLQHSFFFLQEFWCFFLAIQHRLLNMQSCVYDKKKSIDPTYSPHPSLEGWQPRMNRKTNWCTSLVIMHGFSSILFSLIRWITLPLGWSKHEQPDLNCGHSLRYIMVVAREKSAHGLEGGTRAVRLPESSCCTSLFLRAAVRCVNHCTM